MDKPNAEKMWSELAPEQVDHYFRLCAKRSDDLDKASNTIWIEFCKYLFAANAGAAAGLFLLPDSGGQKWYLAAFSLFCAGAFFVGVAWLGGWGFFLRISDGWTDDFNALMRNEITIGELDVRNHARRRSIGLRLSRIGLVVSFALMLAGGLVAAKAFWSKSPSKSVMVQPAAGTKL